MTAAYTREGTDLGIRFCGAPTLDGDTCKQMVGAGGSGLCIWHDPARIAEAAEARTRGAKAKHDQARQPLPDDVPPPPPPDTIDGIISWHRWIAQALARGQIDKDDAKAQAYNLQGLRSALPLRDLERKYHEASARIAALERRQGQ